MAKEGLDCDVAICGAGPVGLTAALKLALHGISSHILEKRTSLNIASKASTFHPPTLEILDEFGLSDVMHAHGCRADRMAYLRTSGAVIAAFDQPAALASHTGFPYRVHLEQSQITPHLLQKAEATELASISYEADVREVGQNDRTCWARTHDGATIHARFLLGADGAQSAVRNSLGIPQEGHGYPGCVLRLMVDKSICDLMPELAPVTYIYSNNFTSISFLEMPDCWRIIIRVTENLTDDQVMDPAWYSPIVREFLPRVAESMTVLGSDVYRAKKMVASANRVGRIGLIGDAVHLTNTKGGMNMNCGIHDAYAVADGIVRELQGAIGGFDAALKERLRIANDVLLPRTDRAVTGKQDWLAYIADVAAEPAKTRDYLLSSSMLDMAPARQALAAHGG